MSDVERQIADALKAEAERAEREREAAKREEDDALRKIRERTERK